MTPKEIYEKVSGNKAPDNQIAYHEWYIKYVEWLEERVELLYRITGELIK